MTNDERFTCFSEKIIETYLGPLNPQVMAVFSNLEASFDISWPLMLRLSQLRVMEDMLRDQRQCETETNDARTRSRDRGASDNILKENYYTGTSGRGEV